MRALVVLALCALAPSAYAQECGQPTGSPIPADSAILRWQASTRYDDGTPLPVAPYYVVYEFTNDPAGVRLCRTNALEVFFANLADGTHTWGVRAMLSTPSSGNESSLLSNLWSKTIGAVEPPIDPPVTVRRIETPVLSGE